MQLVAAQAHRCDGTTRFPAAGYWMSYLSPNNDTRAWSNLVKL